MSDSDWCPSPTDGVEVHEVEDGLVVYDTAHDRVHYLNPSASIIFSFCDGNRDPAALAELVREAWSLDAPPLDEVETCLAQLRDEGVLR